MNRRGARRQLPGLSFLPAATWPAVKMIVSVRNSEIEMKCDGNSQLSGHQEDGSV